MCTAPCLKCERRGCGSFRDECEVYQSFLTEHNALKEKKKKFRGEDVPARHYRWREHSPIKCHKK